MRSSRALILLALVLCGPAAVRAEEPMGGSLGSLVGGMLNRVFNRKEEAISDVSNTVLPLLSGAGDIKSSLIAQYAELSKEMETILTTYEEEYCTPAEFTPSSKQPATFVGHSFALTLDTGSCYFNDTAYMWEGAKELNCTEPSISFVASPAKFTSAYHKAATFTSKFCQMSKAFGEPSEHVLYVFDGSMDGEGLDINGLTAKITGEMQQLLSSFGKPKEGGILGNLMGGLGGAKS